VLRVAGHSLTDRQTVPLVLRQRKAFTSALRRPTAWRSNVVVLRPLLLTCFVGAQARVDLNPPVGDGKKGRCLGPSGDALKAAAKKKNIRITRQWEDISLTSA
jgi:hypothetical protein